MNAEVATDFRPFTSLTEQIADHLTQSIVTGALAANERVQEQHVARALGVSRGSVREALLILERRHLIEIVPRRGAVVSSLSRRQFDDLFDLLEVLYTMIGQKMATMWDEEDSIRFEHALADIVLAAGAGDIDAYAEACEAFLHEAMGLIRNRYLDDVVDSMLPLARRALHRLVQLDPDLLTNGVRSWQTWHDAMAAEDPDAVERAVKSCFSRHRATLTRSLNG
ncbi:MAG: GntR family transcriptional regulator [Gammaproteobacteria bacterium]|nr:MAG: GntR family transcriptional regulator [Gammaproteobacteria bacterium]